MADNSSVEDTFEPFLMFALISMVLYGVLCAQVYHYFISYSDDKPPTKVAVVFVLLMETLQQVFLVHTLWFYIRLIAKDVNDVTTSTGANWSYRGRVILTALDAVAVECFFILRLWLLSERRKIYLLLLLPVAVAFGLGIVTTVHVYRYPPFGVVKSSICDIIAWAATRAFADVAIALATCCKLYRSREGVSVQFQSVLATVFYFTLTTGLLTSVCALLILITYFTNPFVFVHAGIYTVYGKVFAISMLAALNNRRSLRARAHHDVDLDRIEVMGVSTSENADTGSETNAMRFIPHLRRLEESDDASDPESQKTPETPIEHVEIPTPVL